MLYGAIIGDIVGSVYEFNNIKTKKFNFFTEKMFFTDDTVMSIAVYNALLKCKGDYTKLSEHNQEYIFWVPYPVFDLKQLQFSLQEW